MSSLLIKGGTVINEGSRSRMDILITDGLFTSVNELFRDDPRVDEVIDARGMLVVPGIIDDQVHFRQPGLESKGTIATESRAAVAGGITSFMEMPNTNPPTITLERLQEKMDIADRDSWCNYSFYLGATNHNLDELQRLDREKVCGVKVFMGSSTGNLLVDSDIALQGIFSALNVPVAVHAEDEDTIQNNISEFRQRYGDTGTASLHPEIRSREACMLCTARAIRYAEQGGGHLHLLHISTAEEVQMIREAKGRGVKLSAEVCVHHLFFTEEDYAERGNLIKWNPSIKTDRDRQGLIAGLLDGTIDVVATDHAPHMLSEKMLPYFSAPSGGPLVEHSLVVMLEMARQGMFTVEQVIGWMAHQPANLFGIDRRGYIREGYYADLAIIHPDDIWTLEGSSTHYHVKWSPLDGLVFHNRVITTIVNGKVVYNNGIFNDKNRDPKALTFQQRGRSRG
jgi:dihydroorotase